MESEQKIALILKDLLPAMIKIEGGRFLMGSEKDDGEQPIHEVTVPDFYLGQHPVTVAQYMTFVEATDSNHPEWMEAGNEYNIDTGTDDHYKHLGHILKASNYPIVGISWQNAKAYCAWLSKQTGEAYRLPSEAEWEYAARGGNKSNGYRYAGSNKLEEVGWYDRNSHRETKPVGMKMPNELGLYDMSGNVWEWCEDHWHENYEGAPLDGSAWIDGDSVNRVIRGGSWFYIDFNCRVSNRYDWYDYDRDRSVGFRLARYLC